MLLIPEPSLDALPASLGGPATMTPSAACEVAGRSPGAECHREDSAGGESTGDDGGD